MKRADFRKAADEVYAERFRKLGARPETVVVTGSLKYDGAQTDRGNPATADLPILMLTAKGFELSHQELTEKWSVLAVIAKPFSPRELLQRVDSVLGEEALAAASE